MSEIDKIRSYCLSKGYSKQVAEMDLEAQVSRWEKLIDYFIESDYQYRFYYYDYLNDMDGRRILNECLALFTLDSGSELLSRLEAADSLLKSITVPIDTCIWGKENAEKMDMKSIQIGGIFDDLNLLIAVGMKLIERYNLGLLWTRIPRHRDRTLAGE